MPVRKVIPPSIANTISMSNLFVASTLLLLVAVSAGAVSEVSGNLAQNPGFESGLAHWDKVGKADFAVDRLVKRAGRQSLRVTVSPEQTLDYQRVEQAFSVKPGETYIATIGVRCGKLEGGLGAYAALIFLKDGKRVSAPQSFVTKGRSWHTLRVEAKVPGNANQMRLGLVVHGHGSAWFDSVVLGRPAPQPARAVFEMKPRKLITDNWRGFGFQGDIFLYRQSNIDAGLTDGDRKLVKQRIRAMRPQMVRLLFDLASWEPERGKHTPDSEGMKDLCETLAVYKEVGADVQLTEWGLALPSWAGPDSRHPLKGQRAAIAQSFVAAVKYLRNERGFDNLRYVTLYNEPNYPAVDWDDYVTMYRALDRSLKAEGLRDDVAVVGPDEANNYELLPKAIADLNDVIDYYDAHNYTADTGAEFGLWVTPKVQDMPKTSSGSPARKRLLVTEFGMRDRMETFMNPHNDEYEYGVFLADSAICAADAGASAMLMWCVGDTHYYGHRMKWGLWKLRDERRSQPRHARRPHIPPRA